MDRREMLRLGLALSSTAVAGSTAAQVGDAGTIARAPEVNLVSDGRRLSAVQYAALLRELAETSAVGADTYGAGGAVQALEEEFAKRTGKEKALFLPTGTMANQLALKLLAGEKSKIFVQDQSHIYRDEEDAAQVVHGKRLMPLAPDAATFTLEELQAAIDHYRRNEIFETGVGAIAIENPVRRRDEEIFDFGEIEKIARFARASGIGMHLDGARLYAASAWSGVSIREYSAHFDTVYVSLYKCFSAGAGAMLAGSESLINSAAHWMKLYGGTMRQNWHNAMIARHFLPEYEDRIPHARNRAEEFFRELDRIEQFSVERRSRGSNATRVSVQGVDPEAFRAILRDTYNVLIPRPRNDGSFLLKVNPSILDVPLQTLVEAFRSGVTA